MLTMIGMMITRMMIKVNGDDGDNLMMMMIMIMDK